MPTLKYRFGYGCRVVLAVAEDKECGVVIGFSIYGKGEPLYKVRWADYKFGHYYESELEAVSETVEGGGDASP